MEDKEKLKVLIVDDEEIVRNGIRNLINWEIGRAHV